MTDDADDPVPDPDAIPSGLLRRLRAAEREMVAVYDMFVVATAKAVVEERGFADGTPSRQEIEDVLVEGFANARILLLSGAFLRHGFESADDGWEGLIGDVEVAVLTGRHGPHGIDEEPWDDES